MPDEKMKYPLLEFEYDKKLYEELLTLNPHPEFVDKDLTAPENYTHKDFGTYNGDALNALFHAANIIRQLDGFFPEIISHSSSIPSHFPIPSILIWKVSVRMSRITVPV